MTRTRVWDLPTRLVHWLLVALVAFSWWSAETQHMEWHRYSGYTLLGVLIFRIYWGIVGSSTARFAQFVKGPKAIVRYLRDGGNLTIGHNPLGALSVLALLGLLITQISLGLFTVDVDGLESGPLSNLVSFETGRACAKAHEIVFNVLLVFVVVHVAAIFFYLLVKRDNLVSPMITGWKKTAAAVEQIKLASWWLALSGIALATLIVWSIV